MHSKHILHRDLKCENVFLTHNDVIKVGDFGIARALRDTRDVASTVAGTPYIMAPEICRNESYGPKTDIWALGCILYEIATFRKPFEDINAHLVFEKILHKECDPLPDEADYNIKMLVAMMLNKDPSRRPTVWDLANFPVILDCILSFVDEAGCAETILPLFDHDPRRRVATERE